MHMTIAGIQLHLYCNKYVMYLIVAIMIVENKYFIFNNCDRTVTVLLMITLHSPSNESCYFPVSATEV